MHDIIGTCSFYAIQIRHKTNRAADLVLSQPAFYLGFISRSSGWVPDLTRATKELTRCQLLRRAQVVVFFRAPMTCSGTFTFRTHATLRPRIISLDESLSYNCYRQRSLYAKVLALAERSFPEGKGRTAH
ncbi:hypothetical protein M3J09_004001 [Ascochyta lentis]